MAPSAELTPLHLRARAAKHWKDNRMSGYTLRITCRLGQFLSAIIIMALYCIDLQHFTSTNTRAPAAWVYAELIAGFSILLCLVHFWYMLSSTWWCVPEFVLVVLWAAQAGVFGTIYLSDPREEVEGVDERRMKAGVAFGIISMVLWLVSFVQTLVWGCQRWKVKRGLRREQKFDRALEGMREEMRVAVASKPPGYEAAAVRDSESEPKRKESKDEDLNDEIDVQPPAYEAGNQDGISFPERCQLEEFEKWQGRNTADHLV